MILKCLIDHKIINNAENIIKKNIKALYVDNKLSYKDDIDSIKITINNDNIIMIKENIDSKITFNFIKNKKTNLEYFIKMINSYLDGQLLTNELIIDKNKINIKYELWIQDEYIGKYEYEVNIKEILQ